MRDSWREMSGAGGGTGPDQQGLHQDVLWAGEGEAQYDPDHILSPSPPGQGPAQRHPDGGQEPLGDALCPQVCDEVHVITKYCQNIYI